MKKKRLLKLALRLALWDDHEEQVGFNMQCLLEKDTRDYRREECGTVACIAGHAALMSGAPVNANTDWMKVIEPARIYLGLTDEQAERLFLTDVPVGTIPSTITPKTAAKVIARFVETGKVQWPHEKGRTW